MKMSKEHYKIIKQSIAALVDTVDTPINHYEYLKTDERVKDLPRRFRWDCLWAGQRYRVSQGGDAFDLIEYNDDHIDTALRSIMKELELPQ